MVGDDDADTAAAEDSLRAELAGLPIYSIDQPQRLAPDGTRTGGLPELGVLLLTIANNADTVLSVFAVIRGWFNRRRGGRLEVRIGEHELILDAATGRQQEELVKLFVEQVRRG